MNQFYAPPEQRAGDLIAIGGDEARHISKVLRHKAGDELILTDGCGNRYFTRIESITKRDLYCKIEHQEVILKEPDRMLVLSRLHRRQRMEWALEKATELGINHFILYNAIHSERSKVKYDRFEQILIAAMKQSARVFLPKIKLADSIEEALHHTQVTARLVGHEKTDLTVPLSFDPQKDSVSFWIGPEGGFSDEEINVLGENKAVMCRLGAYRLRAETAAIAIISRYLL